MKPYCWTCHDCQGSNTSDAAHCSACGFPAIASGRAIAAARAARKPPTPPDTDAPPPHFAWFLRDQPAEFVSPHSIDDAIKRLREAVQPTVLSSILLERVVGTVNADEVRLHRDSWPGGRWFEFDGRFEVIDGHTILRGVFKVDVLTRAFISLWSLAAGVTMVVGTASAAFSRADTTSPWLMVGLGTLLCGAEALLISAGTRVETGSRWVRSWSTRCRREPTFGT